MKKIITILLITMFIGTNPMISNGESYLDRPFNSNIQCEVCEETGTELEIWYDSNNIKHYTCLEKCTNGLDILYGPMVREKDTDEEMIIERDTDEEIVYWNGGRSSSNKYHKYSNCSGMKGAVKMTRNEARERGHVACKKCY